MYITGHFVKPQMHFLSINKTPEMRIPLFTFVLKVSKIEGFHCTPSIPLPILSYCCIPYYNHKNNAILTQSMK